MEFENVESNVFRACNSKIFWRGYFQIPIIKKIAPLALVYQFCLFSIFPGYGASDVRFLLEFSAMHRENALIIFFFREREKVRFFTLVKVNIYLQWLLSFCSVKIKVILPFLFSLSQDDNGNGLSDEEIVGEVMTFMFAGHDTTASGMYTREIAIFFFLWCRSYFGLSDSCNVCILLFISVIVIIVSIITTVFLLLLIIIIKVVIIDIIIIIIIIIITITIVIMFRITFLAFSPTANHFTPIKTSKRTHWSLFTLNFSLVIAWTLYNLAKYPEHQEKCRQEVDEVVGLNQDLDW